MSAELNMLIVSKHASKENIVSVIEDISDWWQLLLTESTPFTSLEDRGGATVLKVGGIFFDPPTFWPVGGGQNIAWIAKSA